MILGLSTNAVEIYNRLQKEFACKHKFTICTFDIGYIQFMKMAIVEWETKNGSKLIVEHKFYKHIKP
jgi:hypothetical protein